MKSLYLMRHAKSDWNAAFSHDHSRPLNGRGRRAAGAVGEWLAANEQVPDLVLCSTAERTRSTLQIAVESGAWDCDIEHHDAIYGAGPDVLITVARSAPDAVEALMLVGHEPGMSTTLSVMLGQASVRFPTAAVANVRFDVDRWADLSPGRGQLIFFLPPRLLNSA